MIRVDCPACHQSFPMNETAKIEGRVLCHQCAGEGAKKSRQIDPTVCCGCGADFGSSELSKLQSGLPVCEPCRQKFLHRPYPDWVKLSFAGLVAIAILSLAVNWRFTVAYRELRRAGREYQAGRFESASSLMASASARVPESVMLRVSAELTRAGALMNEDRSAEALTLLLDLAAKHPHPYIGEMITQAEIGAAFDRHDYDAFLAKVQQAIAKTPNDPMALTALASAYAAKYAATGDSAYQTQSLEKLERAKSLAGGKRADIAEYEQRIRHRLATREILSPSEYKRRFPNGWKGDAQ
jgi:tetratricopeptide (TPR) repeat protein